MSPKPCGTDQQPRIRIEMPDAFAVRYRHQNINLPDAREALTRVLIDLRTNHPPAKRGREPAEVPFICIVVHPRTKATQSSIGGEVTVWRVCQAIEDTIYLINLDLFGEEIHDRTRHQHAEGAPSPAGDVGLHGEEPGNP